MAGRKMLEELRHFKELAFLNGEWKLARTGKTFPVLNPASGEILANVPDLQEHDILEAIDSADSAFQKWRFTSCRVRSNLLLKAAEKMQENRRDLGKIITLESGKPIQESVGEVLYAASFLTWFAEEAKRINGDILPTVESGSRKFILKQPVGVSGLITPWNFPLAMITRKAGAALAAGCSVVLKPSEETPLSALAFSSLMEDISAPPGLVNVVTCSRESTEEAGMTLCDSDIIRKISFTGSTNVGKWLVERSAKTMKRVSMELGGNAPFIVFNSADPKLAAISALKCRFRNTGQTCICAERIFVQEGIYDKFLEEFQKAVGTLRGGDPLDQNTTTSCLINSKAMEKVQLHLEDALSLGGTLICGGELQGYGSLSFPPTIISNCNLDMKCIQEETFGPIAPVMKFDSEEEVVALANTQNSGLAGYFFSTDFDQIWRVSEKLEVGMIGVNEVAISNELIPFGGIKESGLGREGSIYGINEFLEHKLVAMGGLSDVK